MKHTVYVLLVTVILFQSNMFCMKPEDQGFVDMLMMEMDIQRKGSTKVAEKIDNHRFYIRSIRRIEGENVNVLFEPAHFCYRNPYQIVRTIKPDETSPFAQGVREAIALKKKQNKRQDPVKLFLAFPITESGPNNLRLGIFPIENAFPLDKVTHYVENDGNILCMAQFFWEHKHILTKVFATVKATGKY